MRARFVRSALGALAGSIVLASAASAAAADEPFPLGWRVPGNALGYPVVKTVAAAPGGLVYAGGLFAGTQELALANVALWDDRAWRWKALGSGTDDEVRALAVDGDGTVYAGGLFTHAGGIPAAHVARWNGSGWSALGDGFDGPVDALFVDRAGNLYAGGEFTKSGAVTTSYVAQWNGSAWEGVDGGMNGAVLAFAEAPIGTYMPEGVYAGGYFGTAGGQTAQAVARLADGKWSPFLALDGGVSTLTFAASGTLYAAGSVYTDEVVLRGYHYDVAESNSTGWYPRRYGSGASALLATDAGLFVGGMGTASTKALYCGSNSTFQNYSPTYVNALARDPEDGSVVYVGAYRSDNGAIPLFKCSCSECDQLPAPPHGGVLSLSHDAAGTVYLGGYFARDFQNHPVSTWDGQAFHPLDELPGYGAMVVSASGELYAAGEYFGTAPVAHFDGSHWQQLGGSFDNLITALALDPAGNLYAGGSFTKAGTTPVVGVARWNGSDWTQVGDGLPGVYSLAARSPSEVYAATYGNNQSYVASLDGGSWGTLGSTDGRISVLEFAPSGDLYAAGAFTTIAGVPVDHVARYSGDTWAEGARGFSTELTTFVDIADLAFEDNGAVWIAGSFTVEDDTYPLSGLARWDGTSLMGAMSYATDARAVTIANGNVYAAWYNGPLLVHTLASASGGAGGADSGGAGGIDGEGGAGNGAGGAEGGSAAIPGTSGGATGTTGGATNGTGGSAGSHGTTGGSGGATSAGGSGGGVASGGVSPGGGAGKGGSAGRPSTTGPAGHNGSSGSDDDSGCGCRVASTNRDGHGSTLLGLAMLGFLARRERGSRRRTRRS